MGAVYSWHCNTCDNRFVTSGSWPFYRDSEGKIKPYGHPVPNSVEANKQGISGFYVEAYCSDCNQVNTAVMAEYNKPAPHPYAHFFGCSEDCKLKKAELDCPNCGSTNLWVDDEDAMLDCPKCYVGRLTPVLDLIV